MCAIGFGLIGIASPQISPQDPKPVSLSDAVALALRNNPGVIGSAADLQAARASTRSLRARRSPSVSANGFATSGTYGGIYPSSPGVDPSYFLAAPSGTLLDANLMLMLPLFTGGLLGSRERSASMLESAAESDLKEVQAEAALRTAESYLSALLAESNTAAEEARATAAAELVRTTRAQFEAGKGIEASVQRAEAELAQSSRSLTTARGERDKSILQLKEQMGQDLETPISLTEAPKFPSIVDSLETYLDRARNRGMVLAAKARLAAAEADVRASEGAQRPQVYGVAMADASNLAGNRGASIGITVSVPLFDAGQRRSETAKVRAVRDRAAASVRQAELAAAREVREAYIDLTTAGANVASAEVSVKSSEAAYGVAALRVANGKGILLEQLDSLQTLTRSRADLAQALFDRAIAIVRLRRSAGLPVVEEAAK